MAVATPRKRHHVNMKLRFLGTGTSTGVPQLRCKCPTCLSSDPHDKRLRASALLTTDEGRNILIDCGPDFYHQLLAAGSPDIDALLLTHIHYDHVGGIDDLRPYCGTTPLDIYCSQDVEDDIRVRLPYCFAEHLYPGVPTFHFHTLHPFISREIAGVNVLPVPVMHYRLPILGFRIGNLAYITDCKTMSEETITALQGIDTLVINALRHEEHLSHLTLGQALDLIGRINPRVAYLTHISHQLGLHANVANTLPPNVHLAYDTLTISVP